MQSENIAVVFGLYRSGTSFLSKSLIANTIDCLIFDRDKHECYKKLKLRHADRLTVFKSGDCSNNNGLEIENDKDPYSKRYKYILIYKNPYSWYISYKYRYKDYNVEMGTTDINNIISGWNGFHGAWINFLSDKENYCIINYEDLISNFKKEFSTICNILGISRRRKLLDYSQYDHHVSPRHFSFFDKNYYLNQDYLKLITKDEYYTINQCLSNDVLHMLRVNRVYESSSLH